MQAEKIENIVRGKLRGSGRVTSFEFDSRCVKRGSLFIPLKGKRDGHQFIEEAFKRGAVGVLSEKCIKVPEGKFLIEVGNTFEAFKSIGKWKRKNFNGKTVAITGSVGKTTTKELLFHLFSKFFKTYRNTKSFNNILGVTYTLSNLPLKTEVYIQELGTNRKGEIAELVEFVKPEISIVTAVEKAHIEGFETIDNVVREKLSVTEGSLLSIVPHQFRKLSKGKETITFGMDGNIKLVDVKLFPDRTEFTVESFGRKVHFLTGIPGYGIVYSTLIAVGLAEVFNVDILEIPEIIETFKPPQMRLNVERLKCLVIIDDSYNANPKSMENAINVLSLQRFPKVAIIGEMLELGESSMIEHERLGKLLEEGGIETLIAYGKATENTFNAFNGNKFHFTNRKEFLKFIEKYQFSGKAVLIKGSRGNHLEEITEIIRERYKS